MGKICSGPHAQNAAAHRFPVVSLEGFGFSCKQLMLKRK
jgi:hypothetical protein